MIGITIPGRPVPAARMTQRTKWSKRARRSLDYQERVAKMAQAAIAEFPLPWKEVSVKIWVHLKTNQNGELPGNRGDWDNYAKALCDGMQYGNIFSNDRSITAGQVFIEPCATFDDERADVWLEERKR